PAARHLLSPAKVYELFSPHLLAKVDEKKKDRDPAWGRNLAIRTALLDAINPYRLEANDATPPLDPRWLDVAVQARNLDLVAALVQPGHAAADKFLEEM